MSWLVCVLVGLCLGWFVILDGLSLRPDRTGFDPYPFRLDWKRPWARKAAGRLNAPQTKIVPEAVAAVHGEIGALRLRLFIFCAIATGYGLDVPILLLI